MTCSLATARSDGVSQNSARRVQAILRVLQTDLVAEPQLGLQGLEVAEISLTLVLEDFDQPKHAFSLSGEETPGATL